MQRLHVDRRGRRCGFRLTVEDARSTVEKLIAPLRDLVRVHVELLCQLDDRLFVPDG